MEWWQILILIIAGAIAIRFSLRFDLNRFLEHRRKIRLDQLKNICPHCKIELVDKEGKTKIKCTPYFHKPSGTFNYICSRCGCVVASEEDAGRISRSYAKDPRKWLEHENKFIKQMKKLKLA